MVVGLSADIQECWLGRLRCGEAKDINADISLSCLESRAYQVPAVASLGELPLSAACCCLICGNDTLFRQTKSFMITCSFYFIYLNCSLLTQWHKKLKSILTGMVGSYAGRKLLHHHQQPCLPRGRVWIPDACGNALEAVPRLVSRLWHRCY